MGDKAAVQFYNVNEYLGPKAANQKSRRIINEDIYVFLLNIKYLSKCAIFFLILVKN